MSDVRAHKVTLSLIKLFHRWAEIAQFSAGSLLSVVIAVHEHNKIVQPLVALKRLVFAGKLPP